MSLLHTIAPPAKGKGRLIAKDDRDRAHLMRGATRPLSALPKSRYWQTGRVMDQGMTQQCVGYAFRQFLTANPDRTLTGPPAPEIYRLARQNDEWRGEDYEGTSVRGGAKALKKLGLIGEYLWAFDVDTLRRYVLGRGTVVMGTDWFSGMNEPDERGFIRPEGDPEGGHAWLISAYSRPKNAFWILNSWSEEWGQRGRAWIGIDDVAFLMERDGEACSAIEILAAR